MENVKNSSSLETLFQEAQITLTKKSNEIKKLKEIIKNKEKEYLNLKNLYQQKIQSSENKNSTQANTESEYKEVITKLLKEQEEEIQQQQILFQNEISTFKKQFHQTITNAKKWAEENANSTQFMKQQQLKSIQKEITKAKNEYISSIISDDLSQRSSQSKNKIYNKTLFLENQLREIKSNSREEQRCIQMKIDECLTAFEIKKRQYKNEEDVLQNEYVKLKNKYKERLISLKEEFAAEKIRYEQTLFNTNQKVNDIQKTIHKIKENNKKILETTMHNAQTMKTFTNTMYNDMNTIKELINKKNKLQNACWEVEEEIKFINNEISSLQEENKVFLEELKKLDKSVYCRFIQ